MKNDRIINVKRKVFDEIVILVWPVIASAVSIVFQVNFLLSTILFYIVPSVYLSFRLPYTIKKSLSISFGALPVLLVTDWIAVKTGTWYFPTSVFNHRLFGTTVFEVVLWLFAYVYFVVLFYEYFLDSRLREKKFHPRFKFFIIGSITLFLFFLITLFVTGAFFEIPYVYLVFGIIFCFIPIPIFLFKFPRLLNRIVILVVYFFTTSLLWEIIALKLNQWTFPGSYFVGWVEVLNVRFPIEEFLVWIVLGSAAVIVWYEYLEDDCK